MKVGRTANMQLVSGGEFAMGSNHFYPDEAPVRRVCVSSFLIDETPVTNTAFAEFVAATGHITWAELPPDPNDYPGISAEMVHPGSAVFRPTEGPVDMHDPSQWWHFEFGADWRHPHGVDSTLEDLDDHPVVHVAYADAAAFARWSGKVLPTEAEWEFAARGGLDGAEYAWGDELAPGGMILANYWHGHFPSRNKLRSGWNGTSPVRSFPANGNGLYDMIGNVWEWTSDWYAIVGTQTHGRSRCCVLQDPRRARNRKSIENGSLAPIPCKVLKGGSHLCAQNYCQRYRPAARYPQPLDTTTSHVGFRCVIRNLDCID